MRLTWDENKRQSNLGKHGFDFVDASQVFEGATFTFEDDRYAYGEQRFITLGLLRAKVVVIAHTEVGDEIRVISMREELNVSKSFSSKASQTDWERINAMSNEDIDLSDIPEVTEDQMKRAVLRVGGKSIERGQRRVNLLLDAFIVEYFEAKAGEQGYQALINQVLAEYIHNRDR